MKVSEFVQETLREIVKGVKDSHGPVQKLGGAVNPKGCQYLSPSAGSVQHKKTSRIGQDVEFDIEVSVAESKRVEGGAKIPVLSVEGERVSENRVVNRVRFKVPVIFPKGEYKEKED